MPLELSTHFATMGLSKTEEELMSLETELSSGSITSLSGSMARHNPVKSFAVSRKSRRYNKMPTLDESIADLSADLTSLLNPFAGGDYDPLNKPITKFNPDESNTETTVDMSESCSTWFDSSESNNYSGREDSTHSFENDGHDSMDDFDNDEHAISENLTVPPPHQALFPKSEVGEARFLVNNEDPNHNTVWSHIDGCATPHLEFKPMTTPAAPGPRRHSAVKSLRNHLKAQRRHTSVIPRPPF